MEGFQVQSAASGQDSELEDSWDESEVWKDQGDAEGGQQRNALSLSKGL